jgi:hypothetical protein
VIQTPSQLTISLKVFFLGGFSSNWERNHTDRDVNPQCKKAVLSLLHPHEEKGNNFQGRKLPKESATWALRVFAQHPNPESSFKRHLKN